MQLMSMLVTALLAFAGSVIGGMAAALISTRDTETIAFGALAGVYLLPSIILYLVLNRLPSYAHLAHAAFWVVAIIIAGYFLLVYRHSLSLDYDDGSGAMALQSVYSIGGAALIAYAALLLKIKS